MRLISLCLFLPALLSAAVPAAETLKGAAHGMFYMGVAVNAAQITGRDRAGVKLIEDQFDSVTPDNALKWANIHPLPNKYAFALADQYVDFGTAHQMFVVGHTLMWHSQTPRWVFENADGSPVAKDELLRRLRDHIQMVVGRYRGRVKGWDVVNEAIADNGQLRTDKPWYRILGQEGIAEAFRAAHAADPNAELYYNDYALENPIKRAAVIRLVQALRAEGLRVDAVGSQEHDSLAWPKPDQIDAMYSDFARAGIKVAVTELDVTVLPRPEDDQGGADIARRYRNSPEFNPYAHGLPLAVSAELARRYADIFRVFVEHRGELKRVTFWGACDGDSWLNNWPIWRRTDYPLLFDREHRPKPADKAVMEVLAGTKGSH